jgi:uncharacterized glyoxalase superfamily protein PhnB
MKPIPKGWPRLSSSVYYEDAPAAIDWLSKAFGFEVRLRVDGDAGMIIHSELNYGEAVIMVSTAGRERPDRPKLPPMVSPKSLDGKNTQGLMIYVDDVDAHFKTAQAADATIIDEPSVHDYGEEYWSDRSYGALDCEGHMWWFTERLRNPPGE